MNGDTVNGDTVVPGNTMPGTVSAEKSKHGGHNMRKRAWCITNFNDPVWHPDNAIYDLMCQDTTKDGKLHYHQYLYFKNAIAFSTIKKNYPTAHIQCEIEQGAYINYIKDNKNGRKVIVYEEGAVPCKHKFPTINEVKQMSRTERDELPIQYFNSVQRINEQEANDIDIDDFNKSVEVYYIYGKSGAGKTERAKQIIRENIEKYGRKVNVVKYRNNFWIGTGTANIALYDDFRCSDMPADEFIHFIDYNRHVMNIKGGSIQNNYSLIIITSIQDPKTIYLNAQDFIESSRQWLRRMNIIKIIDKEDNDIDIDDL